MVLSSVRIAGLLTIGILVAGCANTGGSRVRSYTSSEFNTETYRTIAYAGDVNPPTGWERATMTPRAEGLVADYIRTRFQQLGYSIVPLEGAELLLHAGFGVRGGTERSDIEQPGEIDEATLVLDVFERSTNRHLWQSRAQATRDLDEDQLRATLEQMMATFPPAPKTQSGGP